MLVEDDYSHSVSSSVTVTIFDPPPDPPTVEIAVDKNAAIVGDVLRYEIAMMNVSTDIAHPMLDITHVLPDELTFVRFLAANGATYQNGRVQWGRRLDPLESVVIRFEARVDALNQTRVEIVSEVVVDDEFGRTFTASSTTTALNQFLLQEKSSLPLIRR